VRTTTDRNATISVRLERVTNELREIQDLLQQEENVDPRILTDFRDAVNRVRNTAWAVEQYANSKTTETDPQTVVSVLAGERVRVAYQLCRLIQTDLATQGIQFQKGQLLRFRDIATELERQLGEAVGE
jgi:two-component sensor histidine kinase